MSSLRSYIVVIEYFRNTVNHFFRQRNKKNPGTFWIPGFFLDHVSKVPSHTKNPNEAAEADLFHIINLVKIRRHCFKNLCLFRCS